MKNDFIKNKNSNFKAQNKPKNKPSFYIVVFLLVFVVVGSILGSIAFVRTCDSDNTTNVAYADEVSSRISYRASSVNMPVTPTMFDNRVMVDYWDTIIESIAFSFSIEYRDVYMELDGYTLTNIPYLMFTNFNTVSGGPNTNLYNAYLSFDGFVKNYNDKIAEYGTQYVAHYVEDKNGNLITNPDVVTDDCRVFTSYVGYFQGTNISNITHGYCVDTYCHIGFNGNVKRIKYDTDVYYSDYDDALIGYNTITFYDTNDYNFKVMTFIDNSSLLNYSILSYGFTEREYYVNPVIDDSSLQAALDAQRNELEATFDRELAAVNYAHEKALESATKSAYNNGYAAAMGAGVGGEASFFTLFSAVIDAPIQALSGLLNFHLLGFNLFHLVCAVFTIAIIIFIIRKVI